MLKTNLSGETMVFRNEKNGNVRYSTSIGRKLQDGSYENAFIPLKFRKGTEIAHKELITITQGFLSFWTRNDEYHTPVWELVVLDFNQEAKDKMLAGFEGMEENLPF